MFQILYYLVIQCQCKYHTVKSHVKALGLYDFIRGFGRAYRRGRGGISGLAYKRNKAIKEMFRDDKIKLSYHYIWSYNDTTFIVHHITRRIYFKNIVI